MTEQQVVTVECREMKFLDGVVVCWGVYCSCERKLWCYKIKMMLIFAHERANSEQRDFRVKLFISIKNIFGIQKRVRG